MALCDVLFYFLLYFSLAFIFSTAQHVCTYLILTLLHIYLISFSPPVRSWSRVTSLLLKSLWTFKHIAKEKFSVPLRDDYQTVKLPHSSGWVITFPPSLLFFLKWNHQFLQPWQSTIPQRCSLPDFWMKTVRSKCSPLCWCLKVSSAFTFVFLSLLHSSLAWSHIHTNNGPAHLHSGQLHSICKPALNFSRIRFC